MRRQILVATILVVLTGCSHIGISFLSPEEICDEAQLDSLPDYRDYLDDGAVILLDHNVSRFKWERFALVRRELHRSIVMYASEKGESWLTPTIYLDRGDVLETFHARTILPGRRTIDLSEKDLYPTQVAPECAEFTTNQSVKFTFKGVEPGSILEFTYIVKRNDASGSLSRWYIDHSIPCLCSKYTLEVPAEILKGRDLQWKIVGFNTDLPPVETEVPRVGGFSQKLFRWVKRDIPAIAIEPHMPPLEEIRQFAILGVLGKDWQDFNEWYWEQVGDRFEEGGSVCELAKRVNNGGIGKREKIENVFNYTQQNYRYVAVDMEDGGIKPNAPEEIVNRKYGDCKDMSALNIALLNCLHVKALPALLRPGLRRERRTGTYYPDFTHMITYIEDCGGREYWLDSTGRFCPLGVIPPAIAGTQALIINPDGEAEFRIIPRLDPESCAIDRFVSIDVDDNGRLSGRTRVRLSAVPAMIWRQKFAHESGEVLEEDVLAALKINGLQLDVMDFRVDDPGSISDSLCLEFAWSSRNRGSNEHYCFVPSEFFRLFEPLPDFDPERRIQPVRMPWPILVRDVTELRWNGTPFRLSSPPTPLFMEDDFVGLRCGMEMIGEKGIRRHAEWRISDDTIEANDFKAFARFLEACAMLNEEKIVFVSD